MTKTEALKAAIDGKKVSVNIFAIKWNGKYFSDDDGLEYCIATLPDNGWQIVPEYVDFAEAWKAYEKGRVIQAAQTGNKKKKLLGLVQMFDEFEIRNKWLILEDE